ncbi:hypothetical protein [Streptomyces sp. NPDC005407]|uniref:hypothetical protein n=1 Tax=Streptomyces sp. NPDC005407 TaxID=3155340 RepID=UPI0033B1CBF5
MADIIKTLGPYAAVLAALITGFAVSLQWRFGRRAQQQDRKQEVFAAAYESCIEYAEMPYAVRRRRIDAAADERLRLSEQLREIQIKLAKYEAWVRFESPEVGAVYGELVTLTREVAGRSIKSAWLDTGAATDSSMIIPTSVVDLRELADPRERYMAAVEAHLRSRRFRIRLVPRIPHPRRSPPQPVPDHSHP